MYGCVFSTVAADVMVLKHQAISIYSADHTFIVWNQFHTQTTAEGNNIRK